MNDSLSFLRPPYRFEVSDHGPATIYDSVGVGWVCRVKESLPHKRELAALITTALNTCAEMVVCSCCETIVESLPSDVCERCSRVVELMRADPDREGDPRWDVRPGELKAEMMRRLHVELL